MGNKDCILFYNATIYTLDEKDSVAEALLAVNGTIKKIGKYTEVKKFWHDQLEPQGCLIKEVNLHQRFVYPGFIDAHLHPLTCIISKTRFDCTGYSTFSELKDGMKKFAINKTSTEWVIGIKFNEQNFRNPAEKVVPDRYILDEIDNLHPMVIYRYDLHIIILNTKALDILGISHQPKPLPEGFHGEIQVNHQGIPTGLLTEDAMKLAEAHIPLPSYPTLEQAMRDFSRELASYGITAVGGVLSELEFDAWRSLNYLKDMAQDIAFYFNVKNTAQILDLKNELEPFLSPHLTVQGLKRFMDGSFGAKTAWLFEPYTSDPGTCGFCAANLDVLAEEIEWAVENNIDIIIHAIGDRANHELVEMIARYYPKHHKREESKNSLRIRIEHASMLSYSVIEKMAAHNIIPVCQPEFLRSESDWLINFLSEKRLQITYPFKEMINQGLKLAGSSDAPVESVCILRALQDCVVRYSINPDQKITIKEALNLYTKNAAWAIHQEQTRGTMEMGKFADFVVTDHNILSIDPNKLDSLKINSTYKQGQLIYTLDE